MPLPEIDKWRAAKLLIERHGDDAPHAALRRTEEMAEAGDTEGRAIWLEIEKAIEELQRRARKDGERLN